MQTIVYRFVLAQAGAHLYAGEPIPPERIRMDYVYVAAGGERVSFAYSAAQMREDETRLAEMIAAIDRADDFPLTDEEGAAASAVTARSVIGARRGGWKISTLTNTKRKKKKTFALDFDQIAEIEF